MKRAFDITVSFLGLLAIAPLLLVIAAIIKLESKGPVLYRCQRVGRHGKPFGMLKFRTMVDNADDIDCKICSTGDVRVTRFGRVLRRTKLNELPQLINVLMGEMSLVGPRPEDPKFLNYYTDQWDVILQATPGIVGVNQILNRNEEELFESCVDREHFYVDKILPEKLRRDMEYVNNRTFSQDLDLLLKGFWTSVVHAVNSHHLRKGFEVLGLVFIDIVIAWFSYITAEYLRFEILFPDGNALKYLFLIMLINPAIFLSLGVYRLSERFFSVPDYLRLVKAACLSTILLIAFTILWTGFGHSRLVFFSYWILLVGGTSVRRLAVRLFHEHRESRKRASDSARKTVIYGAGRTGVSILSRLKFEPGIDLVGFVDDDPCLKGRSILGLEVLGTGEDLEFLRALYGIEKAIIAFKPADPRCLATAPARCLEAGIQEVSLYSAVPQFPDTPVSMNQSIPSDLEVMSNGPLRKHELKPLIEGTTVAVVGNGSRVEESLCSELFSMNVDRIVVLENSQAPERGITDLMPSLKNSRNQLVEDFSSPLTSVHVQDVLNSYDVRWIIYNRPKASRMDSGAQLEQEPECTRHLNPQLIK